MKRNLYIAAVVAMLCGGAFALALAFVPPNVADAAANFGKVTFQRGELAATGITGSTGGSTVLTTTIDTGILSIENTCLVEMMLLKDGTAFKRVPASSFRVYDLKTNGDIALTSSTYKAYYTGSAPSACYFELIAVPVR